MYRVMIVDDEPWAIKCIHKIFKWEASGFSVIHETTNPYKALEIICQQKPDVVFTDIRMPEISGIDLVRMAREKGSKSEFIIVSGFGEFCYAQEAFKERVFDYLLKPLQREEADKLLNRLLHHLQRKEYNSGIGTNGDMPEGDITTNITNLLEYINQHYDEKLHLGDLAEKFYINFTYCSELFKKSTGATFPEYITSLRMKRACDLLKNTNLSISDICARVGYSEYFYFTRVFKRLYGVTPSKYRDI